MVGETATALLTFVGVIGACVVIWEWLLSWVAGLAEWVGAQLTALVPAVPGWLLALPGYISSLAAILAQGGHWFPVELVAPVLIVVVAAWVAGLAIKVIRIVASFATLGGGGAG